MGDLSIGARASRGNRRNRGLGLAVLTTLGLMALPAAAAEADATWAGSSTASPPSQNWSDAANWAGSTAPTPAAAGTLTFPTLATTCTSCYTSHNDLTSVSATALAFTNTTGQYRILGNGLTLSGGISDKSGGGTGDVINMPLALSAAQSWSIGAGFGSNYNSLSLAPTAAVTGPSTSTLGVTFLANPGSSSTGDLYVASDMEVGAVTVSGSGGLHIGAPGSPGSVNGKNGNGLAITNKATLVANPGAKVGPLSFASNGGLLLGTSGGSSGAPGTLGVDGTATLDPTTTTTALLNNNGSTPGTDFSQLSATGNVTLAGTLNIAHAQVNGGCVALNRGDVATLLTTTGTLSGTFANAPEGATLTLASSCPTSQVKIHYTSKSVTATVVTGTTPTTTTLATPHPSRASTNQKVTLTATVATNTNGNIAPAGTVEFSANGRQISGCKSQPVMASGSTATARCTTAFASKSSPRSLTAAFTGASGSSQTSSASRAQILTLNKAATRTKLVASSTGAGRRVTYTATVTPVFAGATRPSGTVAFRNRGRIIPGCAAKRLKAGKASCTVSYRIAATRVTATYRGDANFTGSSARVRR